MPEQNRTEEIVPSVGESRHEWCPHCATTTLAAVTITAITSEGAHLIGGYAVCENCAWSPYPDLVRQVGSHG